MTEKLKNFLTQHMGLVDTEDWGELYHKAELYLEIDDVGALTKILMDCGARPLQKLTYVPTNYFSGWSASLINLPDNIRTINDCAFEFSHVHMLKLPKNLEVLRDDSFESSSIQLVQLTGGVEWFCNIPVESWNGVWGSDTHLLDENGNHIKTLTIPSTVETVPNKHFEDLSGFETVVLEEGVKSIAKGAFSGCGNICTVYIPESLRLIEKDAFAFCPSLTRIVYNGPYPDFEYMIRKHNGWLQDPSEPERDVCIECTDGDYCSLTGEQY